MKRSRLNREQKKILVLLTGGAVTLYAALNVVLLDPAREAYTDSLKVIESTEGNLRRGEQLLTGKTARHVQTRETANEILKVRERFLPPESGRYSWALDLLSALAQETGVQIDVQTHPEPRYIPVKNHDRLNPASVPLWVTYAVDVELHAGFSDLNNFLAGLHDTVPYCSVAALQISALPTSPAEHEIKLTLEWPVLRFARDLRDLQTLAAGDVPAPPKK